MRPTSTLTALPLTLTLMLAGCAATDGHAPAGTTRGPAPEHDDDSVIGTVVRLEAGDAVIDVTIGEDSPATRDFLSLLPTTLTLEEFNGREKIATLPRELEHDGTPGTYEATEEELARFEGQETTVSVVD